MKQAAAGVLLLLLVAAAGCSADTSVVVPPLPLDAGLVGDTSARPLAVVGDRSSDRLEFYAVGWPLVRVAELSLDDHPEYVDEPFDLAVSPDRQVLYVVLGHGAAWTAGKLVKIRLADGARLAELELGEEPSMMALSADGRRAYVTLFRNLGHPQGPWSDPGALVVVDTEAMRVQGQVEVCAAALGVALDEERRRAWVACAGSDQVALVDVSVDGAPRLERTLALDDRGGATGAQPAYLALGQKAAYLTAQGSGELWTFDRETAAVKRRFPFGSDAFPQRLLVLWGDRVLVALGGLMRIAVMDEGLPWVIDRIDLPGIRPQGLARGDLLLVTDEGDLQHPGRLVEVNACALGVGPTGELCGLEPVANAPTALFPQAVVLIP